MIHKSVLLEYILYLISWCNTYKKLLCVKAIMHAP